MKINTASLPLLGLLALVSCTQEDVRKNEKVDLNVLTQYTWVRYADRETSYPLTTTQDKYKYTDTLSYRFEADYSLWKRSQTLVWAVGSGPVEPRHFNSETSGRYSLQGQELKCRIRVFSLVQPGRMDTLDEKWQVTELRPGKMTLVLPDVTANLPWEDDTLRFEGIPK
ncbi:MAG: hypothetical protein ICV83_15465 [Cytophagales bacterium]|nr:hypothetical protein [Cytophagales bacterium]